MKMTIESTTKTVDLDGVTCRIWEGRSERGVRVIAHVTHIMVHKDDDQTEFEAELQEHRTPSAAAEAIPLRSIL
jgi:hypothetical protein